LPNVPALRHLNCGFRTPSLAKEGRSFGITNVALGQKQTYAAQKAMSALPSIATAKADFRTRSCLLYPRKRTCAVQLGMSAKGQ
jgi:hypothetical protein